MWVLVMPGKQTLRVIIFPIPRGRSKLGRTEKGKLLIPESEERGVPLFFPCPDEGSLGEALSLCLCFKRRMVAVASIPYSLWRGVCPSFLRNLRKEAAR